ncbi:MAG TPA: GntR family transcriptional regulator [Treponema sp.]|jgi:DNA-binding transcriptional regulator YhcF (GntR family)|nr:GntR family transcriptional regulator [Treponema sp.]
MEYNFTSEKPIYLQLMDSFKLRIVSGELSPGSKIDSVRDLAIDAKVNPNTMQKALAELERMGLVRSERTAGRFITDDEEKIAAMRSDLFNSELNGFMQKMLALGFTKSDVEKALASMSA